MMMKVMIILRKFKRALASRYLFDNWYSLLIYYILTRIGLNIKLRAKLGNYAFEIDPDVFVRFVSRFSRGYILIKSVRCASGKLFLNDVEVDSISDVIYKPETWARVNGWRYDASYNCWIKNNVKFRHMYGSILEVFDGGEYSALKNVSSRIIVDVGAFVGNRAITLH